jgi:hypothetical protein
VYSYPVGNGRRTYAETPVQADGIEFLELADGQLHVRITAHHTDTNYGSEV